MELCDKIFEAVSCLTLSGFSAGEQAFALRFAPAVLLLLLLVRGPYDFYAALLRPGRFCDRAYSNNAYRNNAASGKTYLTGVGEFAAWLAFSAVICGVVLSAGTNGEAAALCAMLVGGCVVSPGGGLGIGRILDSFRLVGRSVVLKGHPEAVTVMRRGGRVLSVEQAERSAERVMFYFLAQLLLAFVLSFETADFAQSLLLSAGALNGSAWFQVLCCGEISGLELLSGGMKLLLAFAMLSGRLGALVFCVRMLRRRK